MEKKMMDGRKLKHEVLTELRKRAVARVQSGESPEIVVRTMGFSRACIYNWLSMYRAGGWGALDARKRGGRPRKVNGRVIKWVYRVVVGSDPRQYKFPFALWTRNAIATLIFRRYHIRLSLNSVGRLLAQLGIKYRPWRTADAVFTWAPGSSRAPGAARRRRARRETGTSCLRTMPAIDPCNTD